MGVCAYLQMYLFFHHATCPIILLLFLFLFFFGFPHARGVGGWGCRGRVCFGGLRDSVSEKCVIFLFHLLLLLDNK